MREIFLSRLFFSDWAYRSTIKSPVQLTVGAVAAVGGKVSTTFLRDQTGKMGQSLLMPPNVKGWDGEEAWINANTVLLRFNFGLSLATQRGDDFAQRPISTAGCKSTISRPRMIFWIITFDCCSMAMSLRKHGPNC